MLAENPPQSGAVETLAALYGAFGELVEQTNGPYTLGDVDGTLDWPRRGIYVFFSPDSNLADDPPEYWHVSRIGTVCVGEGSENTMWSRLRRHRGNVRGKYEGGGNSRWSVFRKHIGEALIERDNIDCPDHWGTPHSQLPDDVDTPTIRREEHAVESRITDYIHKLPFVILNVPGDSGPDAARSQLEANMIALISQCRRRHPELRKPESLTAHSPTQAVAATGLWNVQHVNSLYSAGVVTTVEEYIDKTDPI